MKKLILFLAAILAYTNAFCVSSETIDSLVCDISRSCPIEWKYDCTIKSIKFTGSTVSIKMDYNDVNGDFFTTFRDNAHNNRREWIDSLYRISPKWQQLFDECAAKEIRFTLLIYSSIGAFSILIFPEQIKELKT